MVKVWGPFMAGRLRPSRAAAAPWGAGCLGGLEWEKIGKEPMWITIFYLSNSYQIYVDFSFWNLLLRDSFAAFGEDLWALNQPLLGTSWCSRSLWRPLNFGHLGQTEAAVQSSIENGFVATCLCFFRCNGWL